MDILLIYGGLAFHLVLANDTLVFHCVKVNVICNDLL
jgi:hypothetical protein